MIYDAVSMRCSDIFIDPKDEAYVVRFRVDGMIRIYDTLLESKAVSVVSMIKVASGMDIAEKRRPQDGMFSVLYEGVNTSFRVATVGVFGGEKITIRVIASENTKRDLTSIGLSAEQLTLVRNGVKLPSGMILMCGPTGSGKTSTLYSMLGAIDYSIKNVISIEDPIERVIPHISQMEVNVKAGITFASLLRNALRQNPDVICVGEIRDEETAEVAAHAAQTGHLIIATLHSNDNIGTIIRLTDLGVPLRSIAACLHLIVSQRLVRKLCPHCRKKAQLNQEQLSFCAQYNIPPEYLYEPGGCPKCDHTGYSGRQAVFEILAMTNELRSIMEASDSSVSAIQQYIDAHQGNNTIFAMTGDMLLRGEIPLEEFERVNINF
jgi:type II secretory ATPase GspE/PulE/Tfp pilus assembly ATPase PilB-like protein